MNYSKPTLQTSSACAVIQSGSNKPSNLAMDQGLVKIETPQAYEADE